MLYNHRAVSHNLATYDVQSPIASMMLTINGLSQSQKPLFGGYHADPDPPASQSHFSKFDNFQPDDHALFECEFARLASSQQWAPGSQQFKRERTIAMREELTSHFFSPSAFLCIGPLAMLQEEDQDNIAFSFDAPQPTPIRQLTPKEIALRGYQELCREVGLEVSDDVNDCKKRLKSTLVNIVDLIDARRTGKLVEVWEDFNAFRKYTLKDEHRIDRDEAKAEPGYLGSLLQKLYVPKNKWRNKGRGGTVKKAVVSGRVAKKSQAHGSFKGGLPPW